MSFISAEILTFISVQSLSKANYIRQTPVFLYSQILNQAKMIKVVHLIIYLTAYILF